MGINTLLPFVKEVTVTVCKLEQFAYQTCAVDASCWLHKALAVSVKEFGDDRRVLDICSSYIRLLAANNIKPFIVFDGLPLPAKQTENAKRKRYRNKNRENARDLSTQGDEISANKALSKAVEVDYDIVKKFIEFCCERGIAYMMAPYEADAQIAYLVREGYANFAVSEDSDLLAYKCPKVLFKLQTNGIGSLVELTRVLQYLNLSEDRFVDMCIAAGCDYIENIRCIGINKAKKIITENRNYLAVLQSLKYAPAEYSYNFKKVQMVFHHQTVIDPRTYGTVPLETVPLDGCEEAMDVELQQFCGNLLHSPFVLNLAAGNVDPKTGVKKGSFNFLEQREKVSVPAMPEGGVHRTEEGTTSDHSDSAHETNWTVEVLDVEVNTISWKIPDFPVVTISFRKVRFAKENKNEIGLVRSAETVAPGWYTCNKHCQVKLSDSKQYTVLWEITTCNDPRQELCPDTSQSISVQQGTVDERHTLPFKVLGTCYSKERQIVLENAYEFMENNRHVFASIEAEHDNKYDENAIAVYLSYDNAPEKVGYIPRELTRFIHPLLQKQDLEVSVKKIRFRTNYLRVGFYLTINITKTGMWDNAVVTASRNAM